MIEARGLGGGAITARVEFIPDAVSCLLRSELARFEALRVTAEIIRKQDNQGRRSARCDRLFRMIRRR